MVIVETSAFKSIEVVGKDGLIRVDEGSKIKFVTEAGEDKEGILKKIAGKGDKTKLTIIPIGSEHEEVWTVMVIAEGTLQVIG